MAIEKVFLVDDDETTRFLLKVMINQQSPALPIEEYPSAEQCLKAINATLNSQPQNILVFMDLNMPELNGFDVLNEVAKLPHNTRSHFHFYVLTSSVMESEKAAVMSFPFVSGFLEKPLESDQLSKILCN